MVGLTALVASIGLADSINPSTIAPAMWLASAPRARGLASYTLGVFAVYLAGGLVLVLGPGPSLIAALHRVQGPTEHVVQTAGGVLLVLAAVAMWRARHRGRAEPRKRHSYGRASAFVLGAGIMAVELPTAFMYFGAISAILAARLTAPAEMLLLVVYNVLFVAPLTAVLAVRHIAGERAERWFATAESKLRGAGQLVLACVAAVAGSVLLTIGLNGLLSG